MRWPTCSANAANNAAMSSPTSGRSRVDEVSTVKGVTEVCSWWTLLKLQRACSSGLVLLFESDSPSSHQSGSASKTVSPDASLSK
eukprot:4958453-Pyramimonas_sp.AAC.1